LLQVLDDGRLTDGKGRTVDFSNTVIILTSNVGSEFLQGVQDIDKSVRDAVMMQVKRQFRPEFLNRLDDILIFHPLGHDHINKIVRVQMRTVQERLSEHHDIDLELNDEAVRFIADVSYDPLYGARPLRRYIEHQIVTHLSRLIIAGQLHDHSLVQVGVKEDEDGEKSLDYKVEAKPELSVNGDTSMTVDD
jgi:ATP-dependent Clp protease ATP-binding subunit ClpB